MNHIVFAIAVILYVLILGQNWATYAAASMIRAWLVHHQRYRHPPLARST